MALERDRIQNFLVNTARTALFRPVDYDINGLATTDSDDNNRISPSSVRCNEVAGEFEEDENQRRRSARRRTDWQFELKLEFKKEVNLEEFENSLLDPLPIIPRNGEDRQFWIELLSTDVEHPPQHQPSGGTKVTFTVRAVPSRR